jgi:hypothetical protein
MAFLSAYSATRKVPIGPAGSGYWVELREHLSKGATEEAERALTSGRVVPGQDFEMSIDTARYRQLMLLAAIVSWNLDDDEGKVWPLTLKSVQDLPGSEFDRLWKVVDDFNSPDSPQERRQFPDAGAGSDPHGDGGPAVPVDVLG